MISLIILLWVCGWLVCLAISARVNGMVRVADITKIFVLWFPMLILSPILIDNIVWRKK